MNMKRLIPVLLAGAMLLALLAACGPAQEGGTPTPTPTENVGGTPTGDPASTPAADLTAAGIYEAVSAAAGGNPMSDMSFAVEEFYNLSADDLEDFVFCMPEMSATTEEIFIAKVKSGKLDSVKGACEARHQGMKDDATMYPAAAEYVEKGQIVTSGDWILFVVAADPDGAAEAFRSSLK